MHCQGADRPDAVAHRPWPHLAQANQALQVISADLSMAAATADADVVHSHTWYASLAGHLSALLHGIPARADGALAGAAAAVEGRAARRRLRGVVLVRADRDRVGGGDHRRVPRHARGHPDDLSERAARPCARDPQRHRRAPVRARSADGGAGQVRHRSRPPVRGLRGPGDQAERACRYCCARPSRLDPRAQLVLCAGQADTPELQAEVSGSGRPAARDQVRRHLDPGHAGQARGHPDPEPRDACSPARRCTSRSGS